MMAQQQDANGGTATVLVLESEEAMGGELEAEIWGVLSLFSDDVLIWVRLYGPTLPFKKKHLLD